MAATWTSGLSYPLDVEIKGDLVYVSSAGTNDVFVFNRNSPAPVTQLSAPGMTGPCCLALDGRNHLFVTAYASNRFWKFDTVTGAPVTSYDGTEWSGSASLNNPWGIWSNSDGTTLVVSDNMNFLERVLVLSPEGSPVTQYSLSWPVTDILTQPCQPNDVWANSSGTTLYVVDNANAAIIQFGLFNGANGPQYGNGSVLLTLPGLSLTGITLDSHGTLYVVDQNYAQFAVIEPSTGEVAFICKPDVLNAAGQPQGIKADEWGRVYLADRYNHRVIVVSPCPSYPTPVPTSAYSGHHPPAPGEHFIYPSPVRGGKASVCCRMAENGEMNLKIWNEAAELVTQARQHLPSGVQAVPVNLAGLSSGVYFYALTLKYDSGLVESTKPRKFAVIR